MSNISVQSLTMTTDGGVQFHASGDTGGHKIKQVTFTDPNVGQVGGPVTISDNGTSWSAKTTKGDGNFTGSIELTCTVENVANETADTSEKFTS